MTDDDIDSIDGQLSVTMPTEYRTMVRSPPSGFRDSDYADWVIDTPGRVVALTRKYQLGGLGETSFPLEHVVIGETGTGDFFCLDLSQDPAPVVEFDHERRRFKVVAFSFTSWIKCLSRQAGGNT